MASEIFAFRGLDPCLTGFDHQPSVELHLALADDRGSLVAPSRCGRRQASGSIAERTAQPTRAPWSLEFGVGFRVRADDFRTVPEGLTEVSFESVPDALAGDQETDNLCRELFADFFEGGLGSLRGTSRLTR